MNTSSNSLVSNCIVQKLLINGGFSPLSLTGPSLLFHVYLSHFPLSSQHQMLLARDNGYCDGWPKLLHWPSFCLIFSSFKYEHTGNVYGSLRALVPLGGVPLPLTGLRVLTDPNTLF